MKKWIIGAMVATSLFVGISSSSAHDLPAKGSESAGWIYVGSHWPTQNTTYFEATTDTWESRFKAGVTKFKNEAGTNFKFSLTEVPAGSSQNFVEHYPSSTATWVARRNFYNVSSDHPTRWRVQFNSAKSANSWTTVAAHEIGHIYGLKDLYESYNSKKLMYGIDNGVRYMQTSDKTGLDYIY